MNKESKKQCHSIGMSFFTAVLIFLVIYGYHSHSIILAASDQNIRSAQVSDPVISCDVEDGESFPANQIQSINWTVSGYKDLRYFLKENGKIQFFNLIPTNQSFVIHQFINTSQGWHALSIQILNQSKVVGESHIAIETTTPHPFYTEPGFWLVLVGAIAAIEATGYVILWRKNIGTNRPSRAIDMFGKSKSSKYWQDSDIIPTKNEKAELDLTFISSSRVIKLWIINLDTKKCPTANLYRLKVREQEREIILDSRILNYAIEKRFEILKYSDPFFASIPGLKGRERLLLAKISNTYALVLLLNGRVSKTYYNQVRVACEKISQDITMNPHIRAIEISDVIETQLHTYRSLPYIESESETLKVLKRSKSFNFVEDSEIQKEARALTPPEISWIITEVEGFCRKEPSDELLDEEEAL